MLLVLALVARMRYTGLSSVEIPELGWEEGSGRLPDSVRWFDMVDGEAESDDSLEVGL